MVKRRTGPHADTIRELLVDARGVNVGREITDFRGVLTSVPEYHGDLGELAKGL